MAFSHKQSEEVKVHVSRKRKGPTRKTWTWNVSPIVQMIFALWKRDSKVFSSFIHLVSEYKVLNFWEISIQPSSFPWILTSCLYDPPSPQLTVIDALSRAQGYQSHGQQEQQHLGRSHGVSVSLTWCCGQTQTHSCRKHKTVWYHLSNPWIDPFHRYLICHLGLCRPIGFKVWSSSSSEELKLVRLFKSCSFSSATTCKYSIL